MIYPKNKLNDAIGAIVENAEKSISEIVALEEYFNNYDRSEDEKQKLGELIELKERIQAIADIKYYKTPNN